MGREMLLQADVLDQPMVALSWVDLALGAGLILIAVGLARWQRVGLARDIVIGAIRSVVQLVLVGYVLVYIFQLDRWYLVVLALLMMLGMAAKTAVGRQPKQGARLFGIISAAMLVGSGLTLVYVGAAVVQVDPWYNPRYLIPLFGMILGNAMNAAALAAERLRGGDGGPARRDRGLSGAWCATGVCRSRVSASCYSSVADSHGE